jgi:hypothetical protein
MSDESKEQNKEESAQPRQVKVEYVVPDPESGLFTTYANNTQLAWTHFDVRMVFGEVVDSLADKIVIEQRAQITISYLQAKFLMQALNQAINLHESIFGELKLPIEMTLNLSSSQGIPTPGTSFRK